MVNYSCPRCGFNTNIKTKYVSHLRRKYICKNILSDDNLNSEYIKYGIADKINIPEKQTKIQHFGKNIKQKSNKNQTKIILRCRSPPERLRGKTESGPG